LEQHHYAHTYTKKFKQLLAKELSITPFDSLQMAAVALEQQSPWHLPH